MKHLLIWRPPQEVGGLEVQLLPSHTWVCKSLYWDKKCDGLFTFSSLVAHLAIRLSNQGTAAKSRRQTSDLLYIFWLIFQGYTILCAFFAGFLGLLNSKTKDKS